MADEVLVKQFFGAKQHFLLLFPNHIGDSLFVLPSLSALRASFPQAHLTALVSESSWELLKKDQRLDTLLVRSYPSRNRWGWLRDLVSRVNAYGPYDGVINFTRSSLAMAIIAWSTKARRRIAWKGKESAFFATDLIPYQPEAHQVERAFALLRPLGIEGEPGPIHLSLFLETLHRVKGLMLRCSSLEKQWVALIPGASNLRKMWTLQGYRRVVQELVLQGFAVGIIGGRKEVGLAEAIREQIFGPVYNFCGRFSLEETACFLYLCRIAIGVDTGPLHLAVSVGTPVVGIYISTNPREFGPWKVAYQVVSGVPKDWALDGLSPQQVLQAVEALLQKTVVSSESTLAV